MNTYLRYYVYTILSLKTFDIYTDITADLKRRIDEHYKGLVSDSPIRVPFKLIYYEYYVNLEDAKNRLNYLRSNIGKAWLKDSLRKTLRDYKRMPYHMR